MLADIQKEFEAAFDIPFASQYGIDAGNIWYEIGPKNSLRELFSLSFRFVNDVRLIMELKPDTYSLPFVSGLGRAEEEDKLTFVSYARLFEERRAKVNFQINHIPASLTDYSSWPDSWTHVALRISKSPVSAGDIEHESVILDWGIPMMGMILSLANVVPLEPEVVLESPQEEGAVKKTLTTKYERSPINRALCLAAKGYSCSVCGMNFQQTYGELGREFIHVHHAVPVSKMGGNYKVDPLKELFPVCPNCHAMLHRTDPPMSIEELRTLLTVSSQKE